MPIVMVMAMVIRRADPRARRAMVVAPAPVVTRPTRRAERKQARRAWRSSWRRTALLDGFRRTWTNRKYAMHAMRKTLENSRKTAENQGRKQHPVG